jgi:hypothetical protein
MNTGVVAEAVTTVVEFRSAPQWVRRFYQSFATIQHFNLNCTTACHGVAIPKVGRAVGSLIAKER